MRLAFARGVSLAEWEATTGHDEWILWKAFQELYDLPDAFNVVARLAPMIDGALGGKRDLYWFAPYFRPPAGRPGGPGVRGALDFAKGVWRERQRKKRQPR